VSLPFRVRTTNSQSHCMGM